MVGVKRRRSETKNRESTEAGTFKLTNGPEAEQAHEHHGAAAALLDFRADFGRAVGKAPIEHGLAGVECLPAARRAKEMDGQRSGPLPAGFGEPKIITIAQREIGGIGKPLCGVEVA